jgi:uncharacterized protein YndB with AHSA1/START domain
VDPVSVSIIIDAPREQVFAYLSDIANHAAFLDHFLVDWRLTRERSTGEGAGARFRIRAPGNRFAWGDVTLVEVARPHVIVEVGRMGKANRIPLRVVYELVEAPDRMTKLRLTFQTRPAVLSDRLMEALGGRLWVRRQHARALRRLRAIIEGARGVDAGAPGPAGASSRVTVAGG